MREQINKRFWDAAGALHASFDLDAVVRAFHSAIAPRLVIEANALYIRAHEPGLPFEQGMAVLVTNEFGHGGITFYRAWCRRLTERERRALQLLVTPLGHEISRCRGYVRAVELRELIDIYLSTLGAGVLIMDERGREQFRSGGLIDFIGSWFDAEESAPNGLPRILPRWLDDVLRWPSGRTTGRVHAQERDTAQLYTRGQRIESAGGRRYVAFLFAERALLGGLPKKMARKLAPRQHEVAQMVLRGWDNRSIAQHLGCAPGTVKKHVYMIFERLGVESRIQLQLLAQRSRNKW